MLGVVCCCQWLTQRPSHEAVCADVGELSVCTVRAVYVAVSRVPQVHTPLQVAASMYVANNVIAFAVGDARPTCGLATPTKKLRKIEHGT